MASQQRYTAEQVAKALTDTRGLVWPAAQKLGCSDETIYNYMKRYESVRRACESQRNRFLDNTELRLVEAVEKDKAPWAIAFTLRTIGRHRGYVEKTEHDVNQTTTTTVVHEHRHRLEALSIDDLEALEAIGAKLTEARSGTRRLPGDTIDAGDEEPEVVRSERLSEL